MTSIAPDDPGTRSDANWAKPVDRLSAAGVAGAKDDAVSGARRGARSRGSASCGRRRSGPRSSGSTSPRRP